MVATIRYTDCMSDRKIVYGVLSQLNANIIRSKEPQFNFQNQRIILWVNDMDEMNNILSILNKNTAYGVSLVSIRWTLSEILADLFKEKKKNDW